MTEHSERIRTQSVCTIPPHLPYYIGGPRHMQPRANSAYYDRGLSAGPTGDGKDRTYKARKLRARTDLDDFVVTGYVHRRATAAQINEVLNHSIKTVETEAPK